MFVTLNSYKIFMLENKTDIYKYNDKMCNIWRKWIYWLASC
jgi:hypothetical protein